MLYPLKFSPIFKERIWGGNKLFKVFGKNTTLLKNVGESWEISGLENDVSVVSNGFLAGNTLNELLEIYMGDLVGESIYEEFGNTFPLLIKFLDASDDLSIQVHPDDCLAVDRHKCYGKTEFWYVVDADADAKLVSGFSENMDKDLYVKCLNDNSLNDVVNWLPVKKGDAFYIPAGKVHAIGKGILILEIQQTSDITYRIFDYNRLDENGNKRELHTDLALSAIDFDCQDNQKIAFENKKNALNKLMQCDFFSSNYFNFNQTIERDYSLLDSFVILVCISGSCTVCYDETGVEMLKKGETLLIPATLNEVRFSPQESTELIEVFIDRNTTILDSKN